MANIKSSKARIKTNLRDQARNKSVKTKIKTLLKKTEAAIANKTDDVKTFIRDTAKALDMAAAKGMIHKNKAARKKSRLMKKASKATS